MCQEWYIADLLVEPGLAGASREHQRRRILLELERPLGGPESPVSAPGMPTTVAACDKALRALRQQIYAEPTLAVRTRLNEQAVALAEHRARLIRDAGQNGT